MILPMKNKYIVRSRISQKKFREILKYFAEDIEATKIANLTGISRISINKILKNIRILMASECEKISKFSGEIEIDESYFGAKRVRGKRGRGAANKTPVFGMLKRDGKVYTQIVKNCSASELIPILSRYSELDSSTIYSDCWKAYDGLVDYAALAHYRVKHSKNEFANGKNHINGIENFWGYAKHRLAKFKGIKKENFLLHLKECEFRYNTKTTQENLYQKLLKLIRENPLNLS
ncbi:IS1595-like element ISCamsp1 family transposase [Campylobacter concisus]|uniref:IS1595-like element ISCamsp1 family transposase n=1 Tax=Campylobacter concisus TaxID=199 RepID=UPI00112F9597|nr:IS1595-like element ISCamsp1 family transposase [Campylobacter concisus]